MATDNLDIQQQLQRRYSAGFVTDIESDTLAPGLNEDVVRFISAKKDEPEWLTDWRLAAYRRWRSLDPPQWAKLKIAPIDFDKISYYAAPKAKYKSLDEVDPKLLETYEKLGVPLHERARLAGVAVDAVFDSVSVGTTFRKELAEKGVIFCSMSEAVREHPELVKQYLGTVVPPGDNYFAALNSAVFSDGSFVFIPQGRALPDGTEHLFPHQCTRHRPVRAHPDHLRGARPGELPRRLHRADARRKPVARGGGGTGCAGRCRDQVLDRAELVSGRRERRRRHLQLRYQARRMPRRAQQDHLDPGGNRFGDHLEVSELRAARRRLRRRVPLGGADPSPPAGRYRHQDDPLGRNTKSKIVSKGISAGHGQNTYRGLVKIERSATGARNHTQCDSLLIGKHCGAHTFPYIEVKQPDATVEHEATTSKISDDQLFYCRSRGIGEEDAVSMIVDGFCKQVFRELPMEFAVEAKKLLEVSLEGAVG